MTKEKPTYTNVTWKPLDDPDKFRDMDRLEEAQRIPLTEAQEKIQEENNPTLFDIIKKNPKMTYNEANKVLKDIKLKKEMGACITAGMKRDRNATDKMKKDRTPSDKNKYYWMWREEKKKKQEAEGELSIVKGVGMSSPEMKKAQARIKELEKNRPLDTMDEIAYHELEKKNQQLKKELDTLRKVK